MMRSPDSAVPAAAPAAAVPTARKAATLIVLLIAASYSGAFSGGAFVFDDAGSIVENQSIRQLWPLTAVLSPPPDAGVGARPLAQLTLALNYAISGLEVWSYRAFAIGLHLGNALLLFGLVRRTLELPVFSSSPRMQNHASGLALVIAIMWGVHPLTTAVVDYASQRTEALMAAACLGMLYCFVRASTTPASHGWRIACVASCAAGMASKETMVVAPLLAILHDRTFIGGSFRAVWRERWFLHTALAGTWLLLVALAITSPAAQRGVGFGLGVGALEYALTSAGALLHYLRLAFWPSPLVFDYGWAFAREFTSAGPALAGCGALVIAAAVALWRTPPAGFAVSAFLLLLAPTTSFIPIIQQPTAESRMYLPLAALVAAAVLAIHRWCGARPLLASCIAAATALGVVTHGRHAAYRTEISLWADTVAKRPGNARAHGQLGAALLRAGRLEESIVASTEAARLRPGYADAHNNLGVAHARVGRPSAAIIHYEAALRVAPDDARAHYNLGHALAATSRTAEAMVSFASALRCNPRLVEAHYNLGVLALRTSRSSEAIAHFEAALAMNPLYAEARQKLDELRRAR